MLATLPTRKRAIFQQLFDGYAGPPFALRLWDGSRWHSPGDAPPVCTIVLKECGALASLLAAPNELTLGEAFIHESGDVESDLFSAFVIADHIFNRPRRLRQQIAQRFASVAFGLGQFAGLGAVSSLLRLVPKTTYRIWLLYMAGSAAAFRRGDIGLYQVLLNRPDRGNCRLPLTREDWYVPHETAVANAD